MSYGTYFTQFSRIFSQITWNFPKKLHDKFKYTSESREREKFSFLTFTIDVWRYMYGMVGRLVYVRKINKCTVCGEFPPLHVIFNVCTHLSQAIQGKITLILICFHRRSVLIIVNNVDEVQMSKILVLHAENTERESCGTGKACCIVLISFYYKALRYFFDNSMFFVNKCKCACRLYTSPYA